MNRTVNAPFSPTAFGRWKIQFCHAVSRPKIFVSIVSGPANRRFASIAVSASGENAARLSIASLHLVVPVELVGGERHQAGIERRARIEWFPLAEQLGDPIRLGREIASAAA